MIILMIFVFLFISLESRPVDLNLAMANLVLDKWQDQWQVTGIFLKAFLRGSFRFTEKSFKEQFQVWQIE